MRAEPGVTGVTSSGRRVAGFRMCRCPVSEPVMMLAEFGENRMLVEAYWEDVEACLTVAIGCLNLRVSHVLIVSSPPRVTTSLPSALMSRPLVHVFGWCASRISAVGLLHGPSPVHMDKVPSRAAATRILSPPCTGALHATAVILERPAEPATLDLCTIMCF